MILRLGRFYVSMFSQILPPQASDAAGDVDRLFFLTLAITGAFFVLVIGVLLVAVVQFRQRGPEDRRRAAYFHGSWRHELLWAGVPAVLLILLMVLSDRTWARLRGEPKPGDEAVHAEILAQQFAWNIRYPGPDGRFGKTDPKHYDEGNPFGLVREDAAAADDVVLLNELYLPQGQLARLTLRSKDVIHGLYIPEFRLQQNLLPGAALDFFVRPTRAGKYEIMCNQYCGLAHYRMRGELTVGDEAGMKAFLAERAGQK